MYFAWVLVGHLLTGCYVFSYFDPAEIGWRALTGTYMYVTSLSVLVFVAMQELHGWREALIGKLESSNHQPRR